MAGLKHRKNQGNTDQLIDYYKSMNLNSLVRMSKIMIRPSLNATILIVKLDNKWIDDKQQESLYI